MKRHSFVWALTAAATAIAVGMLVYSCGGGDASIPALPQPDGGTLDASVIPVVDGSIPGMDAPLPPSDAMTPPSDGPLGADGAPDGASPTPSTSVLEYHKHPSRDGLYVDPLLTKVAAVTLHKDPNFSSQTKGETLAQPLYVADFKPGQDAVFIATETNDVYGLDAATGTRLWNKTLGTPIPLTKLPCGMGIDLYGISATGIIDLATRTLYVEAFTTPDGGTTVHHQVFALSIDDGSVRAGWPVTIDGAVSGFTASVQHDRGALAIVNGTLYVPFAGLNGDCGGDRYHGWVIAIPLAAPASLRSWATAARAGGIWGMGGVASDGTNPFVVTGNTMGATTWGGGEAIVRLQAGAAFSGQTTDYMAPLDWQTNLDKHDIDLGSSSPLLIDVPGATPSALVIAMGKAGVAYIADRNNLGGIKDGIHKANVAQGEIKNAPTAFQTAAGFYVVLVGAGGGANCPNGQSGDLIALRISATQPPKISTVWCADSHGAGSPMTTTTDGHANAIVWVVGAEGDNKLYGFDGDTGTVVFNGGTSAEQMNTVRHWTTPIETKGRILVGGDGQIYAFTVR